MSVAQVQPETLPTILVIDDEPSIRLGLVAAIKRRGYRVIEAEDGRDGLEKAAKHLPDLIVSDVMMPPPSGFELKRLLAEVPKLSAIPFIFLTARSATEDRIAGIKDGADDYISKPFIMEELLARIEALLRRTRVSEQRGRTQMEAIARAEMDRLQKEILQNFHHELRTPLMNITMPLELAVQHKFEDPEEQTKFIRMALSHANRLESIVSDIVILSNIDHGDLNAVRQSISIEDQILAPARRRLERYKDKQLDFRYEIDDRGPILAPRREFTQAVMNLLDNAFKFSPHGGMVKLRVVAGPNGAAEIRVADQGAGIPVSERTKVFDRFYQISQGDARDYDGLGVGLTVARAVFERNKGSVELLETATGCEVQAQLPEVQSDDVVYG